MNELNDTKTFASKTLPSLCHHTEDKAAPLHSDEPIDLSHLILQTQCNKCNIATTLAFVMVVKYFYG